MEYGRFYFQKAYLNPSCMFRNLSLLPLEGRTKALAAYTLVLVLW